MTPRYPPSRILIRCKGVLDNNNLPGKVGLPELTVRHERARNANGDERPCLSLAFVSDEPVGGEGHSYGEVLRELSIDLIVDAEVQAADSELDPTGLDRLGWIAAQAVGILQDEDATDADGNTIRGLCDDVIDEGVAPEDDIEPDEGRFIQRIIVLYRTLRNQPFTLLGHEENAL